MQQMHHKSSTINILPASSAATGKPAHKCSQANKIQGSINV